MPCEVRVMQCEFCDGQTKLKAVKRQHWLNGKLYIVENVEAEVCTACGERYFHAKTLDAIDELLLKQHVVEKTLDVEVVRFHREAA
jgi:YgiT-type zinc finger domain-containing protein